MVDRKLIYIEPSPEHPEDEAPRTEKYQALENVKAALVDLPTYETIREDLERVMERNELIKRVTRITSAIERDLELRFLAFSRKSHVYRALYLPHLIRDCAGRRIERPLRRRGAEERCRPAGPPPMTTCLRSDIKRRIGIEGRAMTGGRRRNACWASELIGALRALAKPIGACARWSWKVLTR